MKIRFIKNVAFRDCDGNVLHLFSTGEVVDAFYKSERGYFGTSWGGIFFDEAEEVK